MGNNIISAKEGRDGEHAEGTVTSMGFSSEITLGAAVSPSWVLGGGIWSGSVFTSTFTKVRGEDIPRGLRRPESLTTVGFFGDWTFAPELGLHAQGGLGVAALTSQHFEDDELDGSTLAFGPGITLGIGADFWVASRWALGAMARLTAAAALEREAGERYVHGIVTPSLLMTICYNE
jgi:hypothetical protein